MGPFQSELREFIRRLTVAEGDARTANRALVSLRQGIRDAWTERGGTKVCITTIYGLITGCAFPDAPLFGATIRFVGHDSGNAYGTFTATDGNYSVDLVLVQSEYLDAYVKGPGSRYVEVPAFSNPKGVIECAVNHLDTQTAMGPDYPSVTTGLAAGYQPWLGCNVPIAESLTLVDSRLAETHTLVFGDPAAPIQGWGVIASPTHRYAFSPNGPAQSGVSVTAQVASVNHLWIMGFITSQTCPDGGSGKFDLTLTWSGAGSGPYVAGDTIRIYER